MQVYHSPHHEEVPGTAQGTSGWSPSSKSSPDRNSSTQEESLKDAAETISSRSGIIMQLRLLPRLYIQVIKLIV